MNYRPLITLLFSGILSVSSVTAATAQTYVPPSNQPPAAYNNVPQYNSAPQYNAVPQYQSTPQYNSVPQYQSVPQYNVVPQYNRVPQYPTTPQYNSVPPNNTLVPQTGFNQGKPAWFQTLTENRVHDFGTVARASKQEHLFEFENTTGSELYLTGVRTSCGCIKPKIVTTHVKPGEKAKVNTVYDTLNFYGKRGATVTVSLQKTGPISEFGEIQFSVNGTIRRDVVLNPGEIFFDNMTVSDSAERTAQVKYAGNSAWKIIDIKSTNPNIVAQAREVERNPQTGRVVYDLICRLSQDQCPGSFHDHLTILTNDPKTSGMPVVVKGMVKPRIEVSSLELGVVSKGQLIKKKMIIRSIRPIAVMQVKTTDPRIKFDPVAGEKTLHILNYSLDTSQPGQIDDEISIMTNDPTQPETKVPFSVKILSPNEGQ